MATRMSKMSLVRAGIAALVLANAAGAAIAQSTITLTAAPSAALLPDGQSLPMWPPRELRAVRSGPGLDGSHR